MPKYYDPGYVQISAPLGSEEISPVRDVTNNVDKSITLTVLRNWVLTGYTVTEAPSDSTAYVRKNAGWTRPAQSDITGTLAITNGGTGATSSAAALSALGAAPLASPPFTGIPTAPTATAGTSTTQVATTSFVATAVGAGGGSGASTTDPRFYGIERTDLAAKYAAPLDGGSHPLSAIGLTAAQAAYPNIGLTGSTNLTTFERDTAAWLQAEYDLRTGSGGIIGLKDGATMRVSSQLYLQNGSKVWFHGGRNVTLLTESTGSTPAIRISGANDTPLPLRDMLLLAYNSGGKRGVSVSLGGVAHTVFRTNAVALAIDNSAVYEIERVQWNAYDKPISWGDNTWTCVFRDCEATANNVGINWSQTTGLNSMERMCFTGGSVSNNNFGISWDTTFSGNTQGGSMFFNNISIDYNVVRHILYNGRPDTTGSWSGNSFHVTGCHIETSGTCSGTSLARIKTNGEAFFLDNEFYEADGVVPAGYIEVSDNSAASMVNCAINNGSLPLFWSGTGASKFISASGNFLQDQTARPILLSDSNGYQMHPDTTANYGFLMYSGNPNPGLPLSSQGRNILLRYGSTNGNFTLPTDAQANHPIGTVFNIMSSDTATITFDVSAGGTIEGKPGLHLAGAGKSCQAVKVASSWWIVTGPGLS